MPSQAYDFPRRREGAKTTTNWQSGRWIIHLWFKTPIGLSLVFVAIDVSSIFQLLRPLRPGAFAGDSLMGWQNLQGDQVVSDHFGVGMIERG